MSGVGSTNAMKKGSGNNPFLAYSKADMRSYLNSAYTGCIVKYTGPSTKVEVLTSDRNKDAQHLVFDITKPFTRPGRGLVRYAMKIDKMTDGGVKTTYICHKWINKSTGRLQNGLGSLDESEYWVYALIEIDDINFDNIKGKNVKFLAVTESLSEIPSLINLHQDWPTTKGINGWQTNCINEAGKITLWSYSEDVKYSYADGSSFDASEPMYYEPYVVNELYKVVYGNGRYYFEEFYYISDDVTTATVEDVATGKTFYDFTGTKQTGTGTKINPYIATDLNTFKSFPVGSFIKWLGPDRTVLDETTGQTLIQGEIYRAVEDGDVFQYVILPTLSNPADPIDVAEGKEVINQLGAVMIGTGNNILQASTTAGMQALFIDANIGKIAKYVGETDVYIKDAFYLITADTSAKQYYELPVLTNEGTAADLAQGKELINSKGEKVVGTVSGGSVEIITGTILPDTNGVKSIIIAGISRSPKIIAAYQNGIVSSSYIAAIVSDPDCANEGSTSNSMWVISGTNASNVKRYWATFDYDEANQTVTLNAETHLSFMRYPLPYAIAY